MLSNQAIEEFRVIYRKKYGVELPYEESLKQANNLLRLFKTVLPPVENEIPKNQELDVRNCA
jgi:hypothetical protein